MKLHLRADSANGIHTKFTVFVNGANCGQLTMSEEEALFFAVVIMTSSWWNTDLGDKRYATGKWTKED